MTTVVSVIFFLGSEITKYVSVCWTKCLGLICVLLKGCTNAAEGRMQPERP